jgi:secreted trypsin-like serine protease
MWMTKSSLFGVALLISCQLVACTGTIAGQEAFEGENEPLVEVSAPTLAQEEQQVRYGVDDGEAHPSVVKLIMRVGNAYSLCSGSVIHESAILTAAHCIDRVAAASDVSAIINEVSYEASEIYIHPEYDATAPHVRFSEGDYYRFSAADIAVLKFDGVLPAPTIDLSDLPG